MKRRIDHIRSAVALALVFGAMAVPAEAMLPRDQQPLHYRPASLARLATGKSQSGQPSAATTVRVVRVAGSHPFSWGDAAIGGAAVLALAVIALGATMAIGSRDGRRQAATRTSS